ncbi:MAG: PEP-CTERM sorting domain-containing protein [Planctomycetaceae bacterium]
MTTQPETTATKLACKLALASGAAVLAAAGATDAHAGIIAAQNTPIRPPAGVQSGNDWDVDGDGTVEFRLMHADGIDIIQTSFFGTTVHIFQAGSFRELCVQGSGGFGRLLRTANQRSLKKLASGATIDSQGVFAGYSSVSFAGANYLTGDGVIKSFAAGWSMGETGFFGFAFNKGGQRHYGWGELQLDPTSASTNGYGFQITRAYYNDTPGAPIAAGDTGGGGAVPEPSTFALGLLAAGGVAAYRSRRKQPAA